MGCKDGRQREREFFLEKERKRGNKMRGMGKDRKTEEQRYME